MIAPQWEEGGMVPRRTILAAAGATLALERFSS
jgi:hypothetical protein